MKTGTTIKGRIAVMSMTLALVIASLVSEASALPPIAGTLEPMVPLVRVTAPPCSAQKKATILAPATASDRGVTVDCSLTLEPGDVITKQVHFYGDESDGVTVECNGATIDKRRSKLGASEDMVEIYSARYQEGGELRWARPEIITLRNCEIIGSVALWGMEKWIDEGILLSSSRLSGHVERVRNNAPRNIVFDHVVITGVGTRVPLYLHAGVSDFQLLDSEINGSSGDEVNIYLDAESYHNTFRNNTIHAETSKRELMALDGSSYNIIINNYFSSLDDGGIYLYRNCGEDKDKGKGVPGDGVIRHSTPSGNQIIDNVFYYDRYKGDNPAVFVGARNGDRKYCGEDAGYPFGSSISDFDHAQYNVVMQNQILKRSVGDMIKVGRRDINTPNYIDYNEGSLSSAQSRPAGCYVGTGYKNFIQDGQFIDLFKTPDGQPVCRGESRGDRGPGAVTNYLRYNCNDGVLSAASNFSCQVSYVPFECQATGDYSGCKATAFCPAGKKIIGGRAACNLESGTVSSTDLNGVPLDAFGGPITNFVKVVRASDKVSDGSCTLGAVTIQNGAFAVNGMLFGTSFGSLLPPSNTSFGCSERDSNGGDCHIKGTLYCR